MKSLYDERGLQTEISNNFANEIEAAIEPVISKYLEKGYSIRELSHEAQTVARDIELDHILDIMYNKTLQKSIKDYRKVSKIIRGSQRS